MTSAIGIRITIVGRRVGLCLCRYIKTRSVLTVLVLLFICGYFYTFNRELSTITDTVRTEMKFYQATTLKHEGQTIRIKHAIVRSITPPQPPVRNKTITQTQAAYIKYKDYIPEEFAAKTSINYQFSTSPTQEGPGFTFITMFNLFAGQAVEGYDKETVASLAKRNSEYLTTVRENINHPVIKRIILFYENDNSIKILLSQNWQNVTKVYPIKLNRLIHMSDFFNFSSIYLLDEPVIASNGDIIIGENFNKIDTEKLRDTKTLYSLTRHGNKGIGDCEAKSMCLMAYYGSHDTHVFRLKEPISRATLDLLNYPINLQQAENGMMAAVIDEGFTVYNPCPVLTTYHIHCSRIGKRSTASVRDFPWNVRKIQSSRPVHRLEYASE